MKYSRYIAGKNFNFEVQEYYFRKYLLFSTTAVFIGLYGFFLSKYVPAENWLDGKQRWIYFIKSAASLGVFLRIYCWSVHFFWNDTLFLADVLKQHSTAQLFGYLGNNQSAPVLFLLISKFFGEYFGYTPRALGFFPLLLSIGSVWFFYRICSRAFSILPIRFLAIMLFSINISLCFYAGEFKQYSGDVFCTLLILNQLQIVLQAVPCRIPGRSSLQIVKNYFRDHWKLLLSGILALSLSQTAIFIVAASGIILFLEWCIHKRGIKEGFYSLFPLLICWIFAVSGVLIHTLYFLPPVMHQYHAPFFAPFPLFPSAGKWYASFFSSCFKYPYGLLLPVSFLWIFPLLISLLGGVYLFRYERKTGIVIILPLILVYTASVLKQYPLATGNCIIDSRLILFSVPLIILVFSYGLQVFHCCCKIFRLLYFICLASAVSVFIGATPIYAEIQPLVDKIQQKYPDYAAIYTNFPGKIAIELLGKIPPEKIQCEPLQNKNLFFSGQYFPVPGKYCFYCVHAEPCDTCISCLPENVKILNCHRYPGNFLYELEYTQ